MEETNRPDPNNAGGADKALAFVHDAEARKQIVARFEGQFLPAIREAPSPRSAGRAWEAFHYYLTAPATVKKPFAFPRDEADKVIHALAAAAGLKLPGTDQQPAG